MRADGQPFVWRGVTAFSIVKQVAEGREADAEEMLAWAARTGFNIVRALAMIDWDPKWLTPAAGASALPRVLDLAAKHGLYVQVVAFAGTRRLLEGEPQSVWEAHAARLGQLCAAASSCAAVELANENYHHSQDSRLADVAFLKALRARIPAEVPVSCGAGFRDDADNYPNCGEFITIHLGRGHDDTWNLVRHKRKMELVSAATGKFVVDNEPIGAGERDEPGRRIAAPEPFFALAALGRVLGVGSNFHFEDGLDSTPPGPTQQEAAEAFIAGSRVVSDSTTLMFKNAGWNDSPVRAFRFAERWGVPNAAIRAYSGIDETKGIIVLLGVSGTPAVELQPGWRVAGVLADKPGVRVLEIRR
jgi:hypothetical protein